MGEGNDFFNEDIFWRVYLCENGRNLLHFAAKENLKEVAKYLLDSQLVELDQRDDKGETPLDYAKRFNNPEIVEMINQRE